MNKELTPRKFVKLMNRVPERTFCAGHSEDNEVSTVIVETRFGRFEAKPAEWFQTTDGQWEQLTEGQAVSCLTPHLEFDDVDRIIVVWDGVEVVYERRYLLAHWLPDCEGLTSAIASRLNVPPPLGPVDCDAEPEPSRRR